MMRRGRSGFNGCRYNARMQIQLNGEPREIAPDVTLAELLEREGLAGRRVAVEINREIVPRSLHGQRALAEGDRVEIVVAIGGG
jgi:sulfur carrier protein